MVPAAVGTAALAGAAAHKPVVAGHPWAYAAPLPKYDIYPILDQVFADFSRAGIEAIELMHNSFSHEDFVERAGEASAKHKLPVIGTSYGAAMWDRAQQNATLENAEMVIEKLGNLGGRTFGTSVGDAGRKKTPEELDVQAETLKKISAMCGKHEIVLNLHNHIYEVKNGEYDLKGTLARFSGVKLGPDVDWLKGAGVDPAGFIRRYGKRIVYAHLRDRKADGVWSEAMGEGAIDYTEIARAFREVSFQGDVAIELAHPQGFTPTRPLGESFRISREFVRKTLGW